ncbi:AMP-binding protein [Pseudonocardia sp. MH-G8]|uniref:AMP-binding protein n=1 Tax=Pseudonocardia sp. MH-G8 TaxID=1854588 RepID=UPI000BA18700|nr:AMP-binding protein [Pseudonocardia sp. MH-G8]OZM75456.1 hypothetical protein CFP66_46300 [Pseudonocardia sp. MH-G8]
MNGCRVRETPPRTSFDSVFYAEWERWRERPAMVWVPRVGPPLLRTVGHFSDMARRVANVLDGLGVTPDDRIALALPPVPEWWELAAGAAHAGVPFAPLPEGGGMPDLVAAVRAVAATVLVVDGARSELVQAVREGCPSVRRVIRVRGSSVPAMGGVVDYGSAIWAVMHSSDSDHDAPPSRGPVVLTHDDAATVTARGYEEIREAQDRLAARRWTRPKPDLHLNLVPSHTLAGVVFALFEPWSAGAAILVDEIAADLTASTDSGTVARVAALVDRFPVSTLSVPASAHAALGAGCAVLRTDTALGLDRAEPVVVARILPATTLYRTFR